MALHPHKRRRKLGLPEVVAIALVTLAITAITLWWRDAQQPEWARADGRIIQCDIRETHYNAPDYRPKVVLSYEYYVGNVRYTGSFTGFWPALNAPNALPKERYGELRNRSFGLIVFYDPHHPEVSRLHVAKSDHEPWLSALAIVTTLIAGLYCVKGYPTWRRGSRAS